MKFSLLKFEILESTNTEALQQAKLGAEEGVCVVARQQTAGRGRYGRTWNSERDAGIYFSIILRPKVDAHDLPLLTLMTGVAVYDTFHELGVEADIKWVNDILVNEKKIAGILAETTETADGMAVIVGIGINLTSTNFSPELVTMATSLQDILPTPPRRDDLIEVLTRKIEIWYGQLQSDGGSAKIIENWTRRSSYGSGKVVRVVVGNEILTGVTDGLEANGALRIRRGDGTVAVVQAGDVERVRAAV